MWVFSLQQRIKKMKLKTKHSSSQDTTISRLSFSQGGTSNFFPRYNFVIIVAADVGGDNNHDHKC